MNTELLFFVIIILLGFYIISQQSKTIVYERPFYTNWDHGYSWRWNRDRRSGHRRNWPLN